MLITANTRYTFCLFNERIQKSLFFESIDKIAEKLNDFFNKVSYLLNLESYWKLFHMNYFLLRQNSYLRLEKQIKGHK
jgi:hypothetical protein